ncbi:MAG TPA: hypothetical protein VLH79_00910 [Chthonomonadales bacterium]|nr:hypothetical protein [Chthonomonadales bacterium]
MDEFPLAPPSAGGNPAPLWFLVFFKTLGFALHMGPMHVWFAGLALAAVLSMAGYGHARRLARRLVSAMPVFIALGVNFGIVPLLFVQVAYYPVIYPANILMGWFWFSVIPLLMLAYYGVYYYAVSIRRDRVGPLAIVAGVVSAACFLAIGFIFTNNFALMTNHEQMLAIYDRTSVAGAVTGLALNADDPTVLPRWLMVLGLAMTTTAVFVMADAALIAKRETADYRAWARRFSLVLQLVGSAWFAAFGSWYLFGTLAPATLAAARADLAITVLMALTAVGPALTFAALWMASRSGEARWVWAAVAAQFVVLALNAVSRQWVQNVELARFFDPARLPVDTQMSPLIAFLVTFTVGIAIIVWMVRQAVVALRAQKA